MDLDDLKRTLKGVDWTSFRDAQVRSAKNAVGSIRQMRRDPAAERRTGMMLAVAGAAIGAALAYVFDPWNAHSHRSLVRDRLKRWYLSRRGQLGHNWRELRSEHPALAEKSRTDGEPTDGEPMDAGRASRQESAALAH